MFKVVFHKYLSSYSTQTNFLQRNEIYGKYIKIVKYVSIIYLYLFCKNNY